MTINSFTPSSWINWIAENQALGVPPAEIADILAANGFDPMTAWEQIAPASQTPPMPDNAGSVPNSEKLRSLMNIYSRLLQQCRGSETVDRASGLTGEQFFRWYYSVNRPVVLLDRMTNSSFWERWTPEYLRACCGDEPVEVMMGRDSDPDYEINCERLRTIMSLAQYVDLVQSVGMTNDFYMVANNRSLETSGLRVLLDGIDFCEDILDSGHARGKTFFWFGPAGTITPLHHDTMNILLAQVMGRKLVTLIPSFETHLVYNHLGVYSEVDCESPDYERYPLFRDVSRMEVLLEPGEVLFVPVGWWHHVRSLDVSVGLSFTNFLVPNEYPWETGTI